MLSDPASPLRPYDDASGASYPTWHVWSDLDAQGTGAGERCTGRSGDGRDGEARPEPSPRFSALDLDDPVVTALLFKQAVSMEDVERAWCRVREKGAGTLWRALAGEPNVDGDRVLAEAARTFGHARIQVDPGAARTVMADCAAQLSERDWERLLQLRVLPVQREIDPGTDRERLVFASHDPTRPEAARLLRQLGLATSNLRYLPLADIHAILQPSTVEPARLRPSGLLSEDDAGAPQGDGSPARMGRVEEGDGMRGGDLAHREGDSAASPARCAAAPGDLADRAPAGAGDLAEHCLAAAVRQSASAVHVRPAGRGARIDFRVRGALMPWIEASEAPVEDVILHFRASAGLSEPREDGTARTAVMHRVVDGRPVRFSVSALPVERGSCLESMAIAVRERPVGRPSLQDASLPAEAADRLRTAVRSGRGTILVAGPPDSGRSETVEALLADVSVGASVIVTLDEGGCAHDAVLPVRRNARMSDVDVLEAIARHDADVVVAGELTNRPVAEGALTLSHSGCLVLAKISARDGAAALGKLARMGVDPMLSAYAVEMVASQRRLRVLCSACRVEATHVDGALLRRLGYTAGEIAGGSFHARADEASCRRCGGTGFDGSRVVVEVMPVSPAIRRHLALGKGDDEDLVRQIAVREGMQRVSATARALVAAGESTVEELIRVTTGV